MKYLFSLAITIFFGITANVTGMQKISYNNWRNNDANFSDPSYDWHSNDTNFSTDNDQQITHNYDMYNRYSEVMICDARNVLSDPNQTIMQSNRRPAQNVGLSHVLDAYTHTMYYNNQNSGGIGKRFDACLTTIKSYIDPMQPDFSDAKEKNADVKIRTEVKNHFDIWRNNIHRKKEEAGRNVISWGTSLLCMGASLYISTKYYNSVANFFSYAPLAAISATLYGAFSVYKCKDSYDQWRMGSIAVQKMEKGIEKTGLGESIKTLEDELKQSK